MVQATTKLFMDLKDDGSVDWRPVQTNFANLFADLVENNKEIQALARHQTWTISRLYETAGKHEIMARGKHLRCRCVNAFAQLADSIEVPVTCAFDGDRFGFTATEKSGKARSFRLNDITKYHFLDVVEVEQSADRKLIYTFTFESIEEKENV